MDLSIIIVSWRVKDLLRENLKSIFESKTKYSFEVFVVDNNSADGTIEMISREFPQVQLLANNYNAGFAAANNQAIGMTSGRYVLLLNPDMRVLPDTLDKMIDFMDSEKETGISSCRLIDKEGKDIKHIRKFPKLSDQLAIVLKLPHIAPGILDRYIVKDFDYKKKAQVDTVRGAFFMIRREVLDAIGYLDERFFIWFEEVDYCRRAINAGAKIMYNPEARCYDYVGKSFSQVKRGKTQKFFRNSMLKYFRKWHPSWQWLVLWLAWPVGMLLAYIYSKILRQRRIRPWRKRLKD